MLGAELWERETYFLYGECSQSEGNNADDTLVHVNIGAWKLVSPPGVLNQ